MISSEEALKKIDKEIAEEKEKLESEKKRLVYCIEHGINASVEEYDNTNTELYMLESFKRLLEKGNWD